MDKIEEALLDNSSMVSPSSKEQMSEIFNSTHNFKQLKKILQDKSFLNGSIGPSAGSSQVQSPEMVKGKKKLATTLDTNSKKL